MYIVNQRPASCFLWEAYSETEKNQSPLEMAKIMMAGFNLTRTELTYVILKHNQANIALGTNKTGPIIRKRHGAEAVVIDRWDWCNDILIELNQLQFENEFDKGEVA